ncbi:MAG: YXWGXW repeat-containing protein, partial [Xanthobacteraceae bacterium]
MKAKSLLVISVSVTALLSANAARSQPVSSAAEADLIGSNQLCDRGDRDACIRFGFILGENRAYWAQWQQLHPDWWTWETASAAPSGAQVASITEAPPELPVYEQPPIPGPGYIWTPGYWDYGAEGYYWVPGTWVLPPAVGLLWTPGYWGWQNGVYIWSAGYWGPRIGFYGGINYGFGYGGVGYEGGRWNNGVFLYNRTVNNFGGVRIANVYS